MTEQIARLLELALVMAKLSVMSIGGGTALLGQMEQELVGRGWLTGPQFVSAYALGQLTPGPGVAMVVPVGFAVGGVAGAAVALFAFFLPTAVLALLFARVWGRVRGSAWPVAFRTAMAPIVLGLTWGSVYVLVMNGLGDAAGGGICALALLLLLRTRVSTPLILLGGAAAGIAVGTFPR